MSAIATKIVKKYNLTLKMSVTELSQYTSKFLKSLTDDKKRNQARRRLRDGFKFSNEQVSVLVSNQRGGKNKTMCLDISSAINIVEGSCRITIASSPKNLEEEIVKEITKQILQNRYDFSGDQVTALFSIQENGSKIVNVVISNKLSKEMEEETIGEVAHQFLRDKLSIRDIRAEAYALVLSASNANAGSSRLSRLRRELRNLNTSLEIIETTKFPNITKDANEIQND
ncbi:hypothetical protein Glove_38g67 [Diversispora epigaea]|uniref:Uncharacterized protein n=1 Tax=Diversispora epigaea TaxID=1348612 RepID=A0A397JI40_9GLOM|nr:hypothetical protein Glove_38g67 [Diversispora epigaea]